MRTRDLGRGLFGLALGAASLIAATVPIASAQCADPRGNAYCTNGGQVSFNAPPTQNPQGGGTAQQSVTSPQQPATTTQSNPALQSNAPGSPDASISLDPPVAPAGATVTITGQGLGGGRSAWVNLSHMVSTGGLNLGAKQLATVTTAPDGSLNTSVTIPSVPTWTAGEADICIVNATAQPVCAPFTLGSADQPIDNTATTSDAIVGHYQCSSALIVGFGGGFCTGGEPILALNADGTYTFGDEQGGWTFDGTTVTFDGSLGSASVLNRKLTIDTSVDMPDGSGTQEVRYTYIRMNY